VSTREFTTLAGEPSRVHTNPFPGLRPFETDEYRLFFGREGQSDALLERLERSRFLAVVGTSGSGKSSLVRAGLLPALRRGAVPGSEAWFVTGLVPGARPFELGHPLLIPAEDGEARSRRSGLQKPAGDSRGPHSRAENAEHAGESSSSHPPDLHVKSH